MAALNAYIIFTQKNSVACQDKSYCRKCLQTLAQEIALPNVQQRKLNWVNFHNPVKSATDLFLQQNAESPEERIRGNVPLN